MQENGFFVSAPGKPAAQEPSDSPLGIVCPVYDGVREMVACLFKSGSSFTLGDQRSYDAWGVVRSGASTGEPNARYCANLGHLADDESGLMHMGARYYEPSSGRFVSEDIRKNGLNYFLYCRSNPISCVDKSGNEFFSDMLGLFATLITAMDSFVTTTLGIVALIVFMNATANALTSDVIENAFGEFMATWSTSFLASIGDQWFLGLNLASYFSSYSSIALIGIGGVIPALLGGIGIASIVYGGLCLLGQVTTFAIAYNIRIQWYLSDIVGD